MIIDIFKGIDIYNELSQYNSIIENVCKPFTFVTTGTYDTNKRGNSWWFNPNRVRTLPISNLYPNCHPIQQDPRLNLILYAPNYTSLLVINQLYKNEKDILIEDIACGMGRLVFYLNKLGFKNFSLIENFSQVCKPLLDSMLTKMDISYLLNNFEIASKVVNLIGYTYSPKSINKDTELLIIYNNDNIIIKGEGNRPLLRTAELYYQPLNMIYLGKDKYDFTKIYCRTDKKQEFEEKLHDISV